MKLKVAGKLNYSPKMKVGQIIEIGGIRKDKNTVSGIGVCVEGIWKKPRWFDLGWFVLERIQDKKKRAKRK